MNVTGDEQSFTGQHGWAKRVIVPPDCPRAKFGIASWLYFTPDAHPLWKHHTLDVIHLREIEGEEPPVLRFPEATHELLVMSLNPEYEPYDPKKLLDIVINGNGPNPYLQPPDVCEQFSASDEQANRLAVLCAKAVVTGRLVPDSDFADDWHFTLGRTLQHMQTGGHE